MTPPQSDPSPPPPPGAPSLPPPPPAPAPSPPAPSPAGGAGEPPPLPISGDGGSHTVAAPSPWAAQPPAPGAPVGPTAAPPPQAPNASAGIDWSGTAAPGAPALTPPAARHSVARWLAVGGAVLAALSVVFMWTDAAFWSANGFDLVATFLVDRDSVLDEGFTIAGLVLVLAAIAAAGALLRAPILRPLAVLAGIGLVAVGVLFVVQIVRISGDADVSFTEVIGPAPFVVIVGGVLVTATVGRARR